MRRLLVLRHAKSAWDTEAKSDFDRPLAKRGNRDAPRMGAWMRAQGLNPEHIVCSTARRARDTAQGVGEGLGIQESRVVWDDRIYEASLRSLLEVLADCPEDAESVMIVGHNPGLEMLTSYLGGKSVDIPQDGKLLPTATLAELTMPDDWSDLQAGDATLVRTKRPREIME